MNESAVSLAAIRAAHDVIRPAIRLTPTWPSVTLEELAGVPVRLKCEQLQLTGSFKIRGATNFVHHLTAAEAGRGLIAASAGNHAQGGGLRSSRARDPCDGRHARLCAARQGDGR
ncbi:MAG: pyridoxal-phosphate dependent enzyme [Dehalococcoidia bacterium]